MLVEGIDIHALQAEVLVTLLGDRIMQLFVDHVIVKLSVCRCFMSCDCNFRILSS